MKICKICGESFIPKHNAQKFCEKDHFSKCPICGSEVIWNSLRPIKPCCKECSDKMRKQTTLRKYSVDNVMRSYEIKSDRHAKWIEKVHLLLPPKHIQTREIPKFRIDDSEMSIFVLTEEASVSFLKRYGFRIAPKFGKKHMSLGLVHDGILYQVLRFEAHKGNIELVDLGIREGYFNPKGYSKLMKFAREVKGIDEFIARIPKDVANGLVVESLGLSFVCELDYEVYWKIDDKLVKLNKWHKIEEMLSKYEYISSCVLCLYCAD